MKNIKSLSLLLFMLVAIAFSLALVRQRQETRRGAEDSSKTIGLILSSSVADKSINIGDKFYATLNLKTEEGDYVSIGDVIFCYSKNLSFLGLENINRFFPSDLSYKIIKNINIDSDKISGDKNCLFLSFGLESEKLLPSNFFEIYKLEFEALSDGKAFVELSRDYFDLFKAPDGEYQKKTTSFLVKGEHKYFLIEGEINPVNIQIGTDGGEPSPTWTEWSACSVNCGGGTQTRKCINSKGEEVSGCTGSSTQSCNTHSCGGTGDVNVSLNVTFMGVQRESECFGNPEIEVDIVSLDGGNEIRETRRVTATPTNDFASYDIYKELKKYKIDFSLGSNFVGKNVSFLVKGPRHLRTKYGVNNQLSFYNQLNGQIKIASGNNSFDLSGYPMLAGDVADGKADGKVDGADFSYVKSQINAKEGNKIVDFNGDCYLGSPDYIIFLKSLIEKQDQLY